MADGAQTTTPNVTSWDDITLANRMRGLAVDLNHLALEAHRRELLVGYRIKPGDDGKAPRIAVSVSSEVI